jgi:hypothetical protein
LPLAGNFWQNIPIYGYYQENYTMGLLRSRGMNKVILILRSKLISFIFINILIALLSITAHASKYHFTTIDYPGYESYAFGISRGNIVGYIYNNTLSENDGFLYNGQNYSIFRFPVPPEYAVDTKAYGISDSNVVGTYYSYESSVGQLCFRGFVYDGKQYITLNYPGALHTRAFGISGNNIVGMYFNQSTARWHGFLYDGQNYTTIDRPISGDYTETNLYGIDGNNIVGTYYNNGVYVSFIYDGIKYIDLPNYPDAYTVTTEARGINGTKIVGTYWDKPGSYDAIARGFLYDGKNFTSIDYPGARETFVNSLDDKGNIVGYYKDNTLSMHGFIASPVSSSLPFIQLLLDPISNP